MKNNARLLKNVIVLGLGSAISKLTVLLMIPLYTASLTPAAFGTVDILINTAVLLLPFVSISAPEAVFRFAAGGYSEGEVLAVGRRMLLFGSFLLLFALPVLGLFDIFRPYLLYLFFYVLFSVIHSYAAHVLRARGQYGLYTVQQVFCTLLTVSLAFLFLPVLGLGERGYLMSIFLADAVTALILCVYLGRERAGKVRDTSQLLRPMLRYALPLIPTATLWWVLSACDHYILLAYRGEAAIGLYAAAGKLPALLTFAASIFLEAWHFAAIRESEERKGVLFEKIYAVFLPAMILLTLTLILCSPLFVQRLFAFDFSEAALYVPLLSVASLFSALSSFLGSVYLVKLRSGASLVSVLVGAAVNLTLDFLWIPSQGALGAMMATLASYMTIFLWRAVHCHRIMPFTQHLGKLTLSTLFLLGVAYLTMMEHLEAVPWLILPTILPFWRELYDTARLFIQFCRRFLHISTKKEKRS
ncbi:MAG: polysaccharide biosynthesis C-terminal domain-containing protein [Clostridia bacterium]|nr:polysaccharide biosynthesis C-terminal domain-containing protein [Clostridia bacterium]